MLEETPVNPWAAFEDGWQWRRSRTGRVVELWATPATIVRYAGEIEREPVRSLTLERADAAGVAKLSLRSPFRSLRELTVEADGLPGELAATLVHRLCSPRLKSLALANVRLDGCGAGWRKILSSSSIGKLDFSGCFKSGESAAEFFRSARIAPLRSLRLWRNGLARGAEDFARALRPLAGKLVELGLGANDLDGRGVCTLLDGLRVEQLWITENPLEPEGMRRISRTVDPSGIRQLAVARCQLGGAGAGSLTLWLQNAALDHVFAEGNAIGFTGARKIADHWRANLSGSLLLGENELGDEGVAALVGTTACERLRCLDLSSNALTSAAIRALVSSPHLAHLRELELSDNDVGDEGTVVLAGSPLLRRLAELELSANHITRRGARALADTARGRLRTLWLLHGNDVPQMFVRTMKSRGLAVR